MNKIQNIKLSITQNIAKYIEKYFPSPLSIALLLTLLSLCMAYFFSSNPADVSHAINIMTYWRDGVWNESLLVFGYQMMLILVLGHILALSQPAEFLLSKLTSFANSISSAVVLVSFLTILVAYFNWGLGLIFGALLVRKIGEKFKQENKDMNYPLLGAAGYVGMLVWHGGLSGSAPLKVTEENHLSSFYSTEKVIGFGTEFWSQVSTSETIFSIQNLLVSLSLLLLIPLFLYYLSKKKNSGYPLPDFNEVIPSIKFSDIHPLDRSKLATKFVGLLLFIIFIVTYKEQLLKLEITPNLLNFLMLSLCFLLHSNLISFSKALGEAIKGASGILIQFPLYFGIMGVMSQSGMVEQLAQFFIEISTQETLPIFTFLSAGLVNIFVPSGGGQWAIQGPIIVEAAIGKGVELPTTIMAFAYGDQVTNMLQPFWALPLLGITKLKAKQIFPYTFALFFVGSFVFILALFFIY